MKSRTLVREQYWVHVHCIWARERRNTGRLNRARLDGWHGETVDRRLKLTSWVQSQRRRRSLQNVQLVQVLWRLRLPYSLEEQSEAARRAKPNNCHRPLFSLLIFIAIEWHRTQYVRASVYCITCTLQRSSTDVELLCMSTCRLTYEYMYEYVYDSSSNFVSQICSKTK